VRCARCSTRCCTIEHSPADAGLAYRDLWFETDDGERLHGWWVTRRAAALGHILLCHDNAGNVGDRILHASILTAVGFDVLLFDYRGYGHSSGTPGERGPIATLVAHSRACCANPMRKHRSAALHPIRRPRPLALSRKGDWKVAMQASGRAG
jgi:alpha-beta hydrolase superfamily lysophospholipase